MAKALEQLRREGTKPKLWPDQTFSRNGQIHWIASLRHARMRQHSRRRWFDNSRAAHATHERKNTNTNRQRQQTLCVCASETTTATPPTRLHLTRKMYNWKSGAREERATRSQTYRFPSFPFHLSLSLSLSFSPSSTSSLPFLYFSRVLFSSRPWPSVLGFFSFFSLSFSTIHTIRSNSWRKNKRNNCQASLVSLSVSRNYNQLSFKKTRKDTRKTKTFFF